MPVDLYYISLSPPCRAVMMTAYLAGVDTNLKMLNLMAGEQMKPEFLKMNPMHKVPTIDDDGFYVTESQAICAYLVSKYAKNDSLYPTDPHRRALVDKMMNFDASTFFPNLRDFYVCNFFLCVSVLIVKLILLFLKCVLDADCTWTSESFRCGSREAISRDTWLSRRHARRTQLRSR